MDWVVLPLAALLLQACGNIANTSTNTCVASFGGPEISGAQATLDSAAEIGQSFSITTTSAPANVELRLQALGTPTGTFIVKIEADASGVPSGVQLDVVSFSATQIGAASVADKYYTFTFNTATSLLAGTYWLILKGNSGLSTGNGLVWMGNNLGAYTGGTAQSSTDDTTWSAGLLGTGRGFMFLLGC